MARYCQVCKQPIELERVEAVPASVLCEEHSRQIKEFGGEFVLEVKEERTNKPGSMKVGYGSITPRQRRNEAALEQLKDRYESQK